MTSPAAEDVQTQQIKAFLNPKGYDVFHSWVDRQDIWRADPFDVETIHLPAREEFFYWIDRIIGTFDPENGCDAKSTVKEKGRVLLLLGESGAGKTHLMRAFRNHVHSNNFGYFGYMQMVMPADHYGKYILANFIDSLNEPYHAPTIETSGIMRLSNAIAENPPLTQRAVQLKDHSKVQLLTALREYDLPSTTCAKIINESIREYLRDPRFSQIKDPDVLTAILFSQVSDPYTKSVALKYLRCEDLSPYQKQLIGDIVPKIAPQDSLNMLLALAQLVWAAQKRATIMCVDQLETIHDLPDWEKLISRAVDDIVFLADNIPSIFFVVSCLKDYYTIFRDYLRSPTVRRLENDPSPVTIESNLKEKEDIHKLVEYRMRYYYESQDVAFDPSNPTFPYPGDELNRFSGSLRRDLLIACNKYRQKAIQLGKLPDSFPLDDKKSITEEDVDPANDPLQRQWSQFKTDFSVNIPKEADELAKILAKALDSASHELTGFDSFQSQVHDSCIEVNGWREPLLIGICNKRAQGGGLMGEIVALEGRCNNQTMVIVRSTNFPKTPTSQINKKIGKLVSQGHRRRVIEDSEWRVMIAFPEFERKNNHEPEFQRWRKRERPLTKLPSIQEILQIDESMYVTHVEEAQQPEPAVTRIEEHVQQTPTLSAQPETHEDKIEIGIREGIEQKIVYSTQKDWLTHAGFLGASGSGKTTVALSIIEQLLLQSVPVILIDRKGDLCAYKDENVWQQCHEADPARNNERENLKNSVDIALYTPGEERGRPLAIQLVPDDVQALSEIEREQIAKCASASLAGMMNYSDRGQDNSRQAILMSAIQTLIELIPSNQITLQRIIDFIDSEDPALLTAIGRLDTRLFTRLVNDLQTLLINKRNILESQGEPLSFDQLLRKGAGKARLSIISTKFLRHNPDILFWMAQFLTELGRWTSRHPSKTLQAVLLLDEADLYLPAVRKPPTKEPLTDLLRRARSAGLGIFLATQSPGDLDYVCRDQIKTWFLGRIIGKTSLDKIRPLLENYPGDILTKLPALDAGQFYMVQPNDIKPIKTRRSLMRTDQVAEDRILKIV